MKANMIFDLLIKLALRFTLKIRLQGVAVGDDGTGGLGHVSKCTVSGSLDLNAVRPGLSSKCQSINIIFFGETPKAVFKFSLILCDPGS